MTRLAVTVAALLLSTAPAFAGPPVSFTKTTVVSGFTLPTAFAYAPDGRIFIAEKSGVVRVVDGGVSRVFLDLSAETNEFADRGLLGLTLDPAFAASGLVYLYHTVELDPAHPDSAAPMMGEVIRIRQSFADRNVADPTTRVTIVAGFEQHHFSHSGGCLRFDASGRLLVGLGDGSSPNEVDPLALHTYDLDSLNGKIVRIDPLSGDGVADNPYYDPAHPEATRSKVLARGFRNPFRFGIEPASGDLYVGDVGWNDWEEVNRVPLAWSNADRELDFGWPCYEGVTGSSAQQPGYANDASTRPTCLTIFPPDEGGSGPGATAALYSYHHSEAGGANGSSVTGGVFYSGGAYPATYAGRYFFADYARDRFQTLTPAGVVEDFGIPGGWGNPVDIQLAPNGNVAYLGIGDGALHEIVHTGGNRAPIAVAHATPLAGPAKLRVKFSSLGSFDPDGDKLHYDWNFADGSKPKKGKNPQHRFKAGTYDVTLTVSDRRKNGLTDRTTLQVNAGNTVPVVSFTSPANGAQYAVGDVLPITIAANDVEDGALGGARVTWRVLLHHLGHLHYLGLNQGATGSFTVPDHGDDSFVSIEASATDSRGATAHASVTLVPRTVALTIDGAPSGVTVILDGQNRVTPYTRQSIVGGTHSITAPPAQTLGGTDYAFDSWSDGEPATHDFVTPSTPLALTATYAP